MITFLALIGIGGIAAIVIAGVRRGEVQRTEALRATSVRLGWEFRGEVPANALPDLARFELLRQGRRRTLGNVMTSPAGDPRAVLFDYAYTTGGGNSQRRHRQTVCYIVSDALELPSFSVRPEHFGHAIAKAFGYQDVDIAAHPRFSEMFVLRGEDEERVHRLFEAPALAQFFEARADMCAAGVDRELLVWRQGRRAGVDGIEALIRDGYDLAGLMG